MLKWNQLLNEKRRKPKKRVARVMTSNESIDTRTQIERDYDRILFSTPVRRLADKTQVFPLERNDSVRTRLTHSHEVSNLARSLGISLAFEENIVAKSFLPERNLPALLAAIGLVHDLGNPPFGHQGEHAIQSWFKDNPKVFHRSKLTEAMKQDFLRFEGNAQTIRLLTQLQLINDNYGLNLTYATLAALMKYPNSSDKIRKNDIARKKHGFFQSEKPMVLDVWKKTGLREGVRHPLTYIMEACDDIAYSVLDAEDAVKKGLVSFSDLISYLKHQGEGDEAVSYVIDKASDKDIEHRSAILSPAELNDISMQMFRVYAIGRMIGDVRNAFSEKYKEIMSGSFKLDLLKVSKSNKLCQLLKKFDKDHAYMHRSVLEVELDGYNTIRGLMDFLWMGISLREQKGDVRSSRKTPFASYCYSRISENYRRVFENENNGMPIRYRELQLLTDMISGMTDTFAITLYDDLRRKYVEHRTN